MSDSFFVTHSDKGEYISDVIEWNYEVPVMFFPLFSAKPFYRSRYLYCNAEEGYQLFKEVYEFLAQHKDKVFDNPDEFLVYKDKILEAVSPMGEDYFFSGETIFGMTVDVSKKGVILEETKKAYAEMERVNAEIKEAIAENNIDKFLDIYTESGVAGRSQSLRDWFNDEIYKYGFAPLGISENIPEKINEVEIYSENDKQGLRFSDGSKIIEPRYDVIYEFDNSSDFAVVKNGDKFGYIDKKGHEFISVMYDDAYDFWGVNRTFSESGVVTSGIYRAIVVKEGKFGVVDEKNNIIIPFIWDDIFFKEPDNYFIPNFIYVEKEGKKAIYDLMGNEKYPLIIDKLLLRKNEDENKEYLINEFYERLWVKVQERWFYLNNHFKPYGEGLLVKHNGESLNKGYDFNWDVESDKNIHLFTVKNEAENWGVISSNDDVLVPLQYKNIETILTPRSPGCDFIFKAEKTGIIELFKIRNDLSVEVIFSEKCKKIKFFSEGVWEVSAQKKGLYDLNKKRFLLAPEYDCFALLPPYTGHLGAIFALKNNALYQYSLANFERVNVLSYDLDRAINSPYTTVPKKIIIWYEHNKKILSDHEKDNMDYSQEDLAWIKDRLLDVDFSNEQSVYVRAEHIFNKEVADKNDYDLAYLRDIEVLYKAYIYYCEKSDADNDKKLRRGLLSYFLAYFYYLINEKEKTQLYTNDALMLVPECHESYITIFIFSTYTSYLFDEFDLCVSYADKTLALIEKKREWLMSNAWLIQNVKEYRNKLDGNEDTCHYYLACVYIEPGRTDYVLAKKHIERAIEISNWYEYEKKYVYAVALVNLESPDVFLPILEDFDHYALNLEKDFRWLYIRYLYAYYEYHARKNTEKARQLIKEGLAIDADYEFLLNLKQEIGS